MLQKTFTRAVTWIKELRQQANSQIVIVLAANKADMAADKRAVSKEVCTKPTFQALTGLFFRASKSKATPNVIWQCGLLYRK